MNKNTIHKRKLLSIYNATIEVSCSGNISLYKPFTHEETLKIEFKEEMIVCCKASEVS
jgi:hypothetical protein